jgi:hypothetical protein
MTNLYIKNAWEVYLQLLQEPVLRIGQLLAAQSFEKVPEVVATMKGYPLYVLIESKT